MQPKPTTASLKDWLLFLFTATTPLQENIPTVFGMSFPVILLAFLTVIMIVQDGWNKIAYAVRMPLVLTLFLFIGVTAYVEYMHRSSLYAGISRTALTYLGAIIVGVAINDIKAFRFVIIGYLVSGIYLGIVLYAYGWGFLSANTTTFFEADAVRDEILSNLPIREGANTIAARAAISVVLVLLLLLTKTNILTNNKKLLFGILIVQTLSLFVTMSRTGFVLLIGTTLFLSLLYKLFSYKRLGYALVIGVFLYILAPQAFLDRMQIGREDNKSIDTRVDSRTVTFQMSIDEIRKNYLWGTGEGNLWQGEYSRNTAFSIYNEERDQYFVGGTHNLYFQVILQWGILGLLTFLLLQYHVVKLMPPRYKRDFVSLSVAAFNIAIFLLLFFVHEGGNKEFSIAYGLLIAYHLSLKNQRQQILHG